MASESFSRSGSQFFSDVNTRIRDIEEKQELLRDRVFIMGKNLVEERSDVFETLQSLKEEIRKIKQDQDTIKSALSSMTSQINKTARKEDLDRVQRQLDLLRESD